MTQPDRLSANLSRARKQMGKDEWARLEDEMWQMRADAAKKEGMLGVEKSESFLRELDRRNAARD